MSDATALNGLERALKAAGGSAALTRVLRCSPSVIGNWRRAGGIPASRVPDVAKATGLTPDALRPDLFPGPPRRHAGMQGFAEVQATFASEARALGLDPDAIAVKAIQDAIRAEKARRWQEENRAAMEAQNAWIEKHGVPLAKYRMF